jgi:anti-sigma B factor antagonist
MKASVHRQSDVHLVRIVDDKTQDQSRDLVEVITSLIDSRGVGIVIDLSDLRVINSSGLGELVTLTARANQYECHLVLANPSAFVAGVFETTKLNRFFRIYPSTDAAIAALA